MTHQQATTKALRLINKNKPASQKEFEALGLKFQLIDAGCFREVFAIKGTNLVVKLPFDEGKYHSISEIKRIEKLSKVKELVPHLPKVYYFDRKTGIIVMRYYPQIKQEDQIELLGKVVKKLVKRIAGVNMGDIHDNNIRKKRQDWATLIFVDLGY